MNHTAVMYNLDEILVELGITIKEFKEICVLSGTDYNVDKNKDKDTGKDNSKLNQTLRLFKKYHKSENSNSLEFYSWLLVNSNFITNYDELQKTYSMFELNNRTDNLKVFENILIMNGPVVKEMMVSILKDDGFMFPI
jgi:hypothetical protein